MMLPAGDEDEVEHLILVILEIINKLLLLHLFGCLYHCISDARSHKHQTNINKFPDITSDILQSIFVFY
jgi:hypothetical protein